MRISTDSASTLYWGRFYVSEPELHFDGAPFAHDYIVAASEEEGTITVAKMNGSAPIFAGGEYITDTLVGDVKIIGELRR